MIETRSRGCVVRLRQEKLVDSVIVDATIYYPGVPHLGAFRHTAN